MTRNEFLPSVPSSDLKGIKFSDADFLKMLINLVGDLHQCLGRPFYVVNRFFSRFGCVL